MKTRPLQTTRYGCCFLSPGGKGLAAHTHMQNALTEILYRIPESKADLGQMHPVLNTPETMSQEPRTFLSQRHSWGVEVDVMSSPRHAVDKDLAGTGTSGTRWPSRWENLPWHQPDGVWPPTVPLFGHVTLCKLFYLIDLQFPFCKVGLERHLPLKFIKVMC